MSREDPDSLQQMRRALRSEGMVAHPLKTRAPYLRGYGFAPDVVLDVGVGRGTNWLYRCFPDARHVLIDPQSRSADAVRSAGVLKDFHFHAVAAGAKTGKAKLTLPFSDDGLEMALASLKLRIDDSDHGFRHTERTEVDVKPLDDIAVAYPGRLGLSVDTEGSELDVLIGAADTLSRCDFAVLKLPVSPRFDQAGTPSQAIALLAAAGLEVRDVISIGAGTGKTARPRYLNMLFTRWAA